MLSVHKKNGIVKELEVTDKEGSVEGQRKNQSQ
jgi:hypothetical protein